MSRFSLYRRATGWLLVLGLVVVSSVFSGLEANAQVRSPSSIDGSKLDPEAKQAQQQKSAQDRQFSTLFRELDNLVPGDFEEGSETKKSVQEVVNLFLKGDAEGVVSRIEALSKTPDFPPADIMLAALSFTNNDAKTGKLLLERAAVKSPDHPAVYSAFARLAANTGRTTDAKVLFEKMESLVSSQPLSDTVKDFYRAQYLDGMIDVAITQKRLADARNLLEQQRKKLPNHPKVLMVSAELEFKEKKLDACVAFLKMLKSKYPNSRQPEAVVASWYERVGDPKNAETWIRKAAQAYPKDAQVQLEFASWALNKEDFPTASGAIKQAEDAFGETPFSRNLKAKIAFARESYGVAEAHYAALIAAQPNDSDLSNMYALSLVESKNTEKYARALGIAQRNMQAMPNNRVALAALGYIQMLGGNMESARKAFAKVSQLAGQSPEIDFFIASYLQKVGDIPKAKQFVERALGFQGLFLYRSTAKKLKREIDAAELPTPKPKKNGG